MHYLNTNNICIFEGILISDLFLSYLSTNGGKKGLASTVFQFIDDDDMSFKFGVTNEGIL